jgi:hypothetical protein
MGDHVPAFLMRELRAEMADPEPDAGDAPPADEAVVALPEKPARARRRRAKADGIATPSAA